ESEYTERINTLARSYQEFNRQAERIRQKVVRLGNSAVLSEQEKIILGDQLRRDEEFKRELQASNSKLKERLQAITSRAKLINIVLIPAAVLLFGLLLALFRSMKKPLRKICRKFCRKGGRA
ncbi:MAG: hypothetical protein J6Q65_03705, partial [Lentisphaeria bacterium]|nr:hypothetical protein [Lentisphaeria bacterium]